MLLMLFYDASVTISHCFMTLHQYKHFHSNLANSLNLIIQKIIKSGMSLLSQEPHERKLKNGPEDHDRDVELPTNLRDLVCGDILIKPREALLHFYQILNIHKI